MKNIKFKNENGYLYEGKFENLSEILINNNKKVDGIITSPPYNTARVIKNERAINNYENRYGEYNDNLTQEEYINWTIELFKIFDKTLNKNGVICYNISYSTESLEKSSTMWLVISEIIKQTNFTIADVIYWKKRNALPNNVSKNKITRITRIIEPVFIFCRKDEFKTFEANKIVKSISKTGQKYYENIFNFIEAPNNNETTSLNKATYSEELVDELIKIYYKENSIILDPFMGTGTTAISCIRNNCKFIGSEIDPKQIEHSIKRIENVI